MRLLRIDLRKSELERLPIDEQVFFVQLSHLINELTILQKCLIFSSNSFKSAMGVQRTAHSIQVIFFLKTLAGKLYEGRAMLRKAYFGTRLSQEYKNLLSDTAKNSLGNIENYFNKKITIYFSLGIIMLSTTTIRKLRNKYKIFPKMKQGWCSFQNMRRAVYLHLPMQ
jgi:hypothetical protein